MGDEKQPPLRHGPLRDLATRQHGVVSTRQLAGIGYTRSSASKAHGVGRLRRIHRGVYAVGHERLSWEGRCMGAVLACTPAIASHLSAAWLWDLLRTRPATFDVTAPTKRRSKPGIRVHSADLPDVDVTEIDGIPATALARTMLDSALILDPQRLARMIERAEHLRIFDLRAVESFLRRAPGHRGQRRLVEALAIYRDEPAFTRSGLEREFARLTRRAGLTPHSTNFVVAGFELDTYWPAERFAVELDVFETHGTRQAFESDREREDDLLLAGIETMRVTGPRLKREPEATIRRVAAHLERRRRELR